MMNKKKIIYSVEDDKDIAFIIRLALEKEGYEVQSFSDGESFLETFNKVEPDLILLDMMLPKIQGSELLKIIRADHSNDDIDVIIISANKLVSDKIDGLNLGADDYIAKPFDVLELISRVNVHFRKNKTHLYYVKDIVVDEDRRTVKKGEKDLKFTNSEFDIFLTLVKAKGEIISRQSLMSLLWGVDQAYESRTIDMHIKNIRQKIGEPDIILTVHGYGYRIDE